MKRLYTAHSRYVRLSTPLFAARRVSSLVAHFRSSLRSSTHTVRSACRSLPAHPTQPP